MIGFDTIETQLGDIAEDRHTVGFSVAIKYLEDRGIPPELMIALGIRICLAKDLLEGVLKKKCYDDRLAVVFPHYKIDGGYYPWWSARLVPQKPVPGDKRGKMFCPPGEAPIAYLPYTLDWTKIKKGDKVFIHESAIKAANGARLGRWSVGLNGVRGWSAVKHKLPLIEGLSDIPWRTMELNPVIVFDSNTIGNDDVADARRRLAARLWEITGRKSFTIDLPKAPDGDDQGFDDYCMRVGDEEALKFLDQTPSEVEIGEYDVLLSELNDRVALVRNVSRIVEISTGTQMTRAAFADVNYAHITIANDEGRRTNFPRLWLADPRRREVECLKYSPGEEKITKEFLNLWNGMGVEPVEGDVSQWLEVMTRGIPDAGHRKWLIQWMAYPLQNLGAKLTTFVHMYGPNGTGKNALLVPLQTLYGENGVQINRERLSSDFNSIYATRQFVNLDELHGGNEKDALLITNKIKFLVTTPKLPVNTKGQQEYFVDNHINLVTTGNYADSIKLDEGDRRCFTIMFGTRDNIVKDREYWTSYHQWAESAAGAGAVYNYLLKVDLSGFAPSGWAPDTKWKEVVTDSTRGAMEKWVKDLWDDPSSALPPMMLGARILTAEQLAVAYMPEEAHKITPGLKNALGQRMQDMGFERQIVKIDGATKRVWIIGDRHQKWSVDKIRAEYLKTARATRGKF